MIEPAKCEKCGGELDWLGGAHACKRRKTKGAPSRLANIGGGGAGQLANMVANTAEPLANSEAPLANTVQSQGSTYRHRDADQRRAYMRSYMQRRRAGG